jgi:hypothetical protein
MLSLVKNDHSNYLVVAAVTLTMSTISGLSIEICMIRSQTQGSSTPHGPQDFGGRQTIYAMLFDLEGTLS